MSDRYFLDTNVFVYTFDDTAPRKRDIASEIISAAGAAGADGEGAISFQVIQEFCHVAIRKFSPSPTIADLRHYVATVLAPLCQVHSSIELYQQALAVQEQTRYSFYDSLILAAAAAAGCETLYTEDLDTGRSVAGDTITNPF